MHKAIAQSGTNLAPWSQPARKGVAKKRAAELAQKFNCLFPNHWSNTINCLRNVPAANITAAFYEFFVTIQQKIFNSISLICLNNQFVSLLQEFDMDPMVPFAPVVEPDLPGAFIIKHPRDAIPENSLRIPLMTGINFDEGLLKTTGKNLLDFYDVYRTIYLLFSAYYDIPELFDDFINNVDFALPIIFYYNHHDPSTQKWITSKIKEFYFDNNLTRDKIENVTKVKIKILNFLNENIKNT